MQPERSLSESIAIAASCAIVVFALYYAFRSASQAPTLVDVPTSKSNVETGKAAFWVYPNTGRIGLKIGTEQTPRDIVVSTIIDGAAKSVVFSDKQSTERLIGVGKAVGGAGDDTIEAEVRVVPTDALFRVELTARAKKVSREHTVALRFELAARSEIAFVPGIGEIADRAQVEGTALVLDLRPRAIGVVSRSGPIALNATLDEGVTSDEPLRILATSPSRTLGAAANSVAVDLDILSAQSTATIWKSVFASRSVPTAVVRGKVSGASEPALIFGRNAKGGPEIRALSAPDGKFEIDVPADVVEWYALVDRSRASARVHYVPGSAEPLNLDVSIGGELKVRIVDYDKKTPLTARLLVRGVEGTLDPSFGPDYRASGAGPLIDALRGEVSTPLPAGKYKVIATRGFEWTVDSKTIEIVPGGVVELELAPRHVLPTPYTVGCDLHVHARPSFDTPVTTEDRVLSLVAAGVDFAVPTEHNIVGDYGPALQVLDLDQDLSWVHGVEVTTRSPAIGHFGVFPFPPTQKVPPYRGVSIDHILERARAGDPKRIVQVHHPRLGNRIGYFNVTGFDPNAEQIPRGMRLDFDAIEVYNGYDSETPERVDAVLRDYYALLNRGYRFVATGSSDSHRIQFHWAGYPRTMVELDPSLFAAGRPDPLEVVAAIRKGHATVSSGPVIELELIGVHPGDELRTTDEPVRGHLRVRAAPWVDVTSAEIVVSGQVVERIPIPSRPTEWSTAAMPLEEAEETTIRLDRAFRIPVGPNNSWMHVVVRGTRRMDDVLPFMPIPPLAFSNPIWIVRKSVPLPSKSPPKEPFLERSKPR